MFNSIHTRRYGPEGDRRAGSANLRYWQRVKSLLGSSILAYYPLNEISGSAAVDIVNARNGSFGGDITLNSVAQPNGQGCAYGFGGTNGYINVTTALASVFNGQEGYVILFMRPNAAIWSDGANRSLFRFDCDANNRFNVYKNTSNKIQFDYLAGGVTKTGAPGITPTAWTMVHMTWSKSGGFHRFGYNAVDYPPSSGIGTWIGTPTGMYLGAGNGSGATSFKGGLAQYIIGNRALTQPEAPSIFSIFLPTKNMSILGDSISTDSAVSWNYPSQVSANRGVTIKNHAVSSMGILQGTQNMAYQVGQASGDNAEIIIIALGTNDNNGGDMAALQAAAESGITALKASNPRATIYWMGPLPKWTDSTGSTPVNLGNIRTAIAAACTAQSITYWDTFSTPWITAGQTSDGVHPTQAGHNAIAAQILTRL